ncbi:PaaI family thioesterase [Novosphingobium colocasiae]|uniref:PaaI family thioesterase n=1 Tax=Novosphingobium colocasiae TaxID=1256513 RepID=UPI0035AED5E8
MSVEQGPPPLPGNWVTGIVTRTGEWTVGDIWVDRENRRYALLVGERHCNATGTMHGGAMATFLDGQAFVYQDPDGDDLHTPTVTLSVDYLSRAVPGDWLVADVALIKKTKTLLFTEAKAFVGTRIIARSSAIYRNYE